MLLHGSGSRLELNDHAASFCCGGRGDRGSSCTEESRSTMRMVPLQSGHLGRVTHGLGSVGNVEPEGLFSDRDLSEASEHFAHSD